jgi:general secretion pathway protein G
MAMKLKRNAGFTIIEIAVVVSVIAIIASIILVSFGQVQKDSRDRERTADIMSLKYALDHYYRDNNEYPAVCAGDNSGCNVSLLDPQLVPAYIPAIPTDPKSTTPYQYVRGVPGTVNSYGILITYETQPSCKAGVNVASGWWGAGVPTCEDG